MEGKSRKIFRLKSKKLKDSKGMDFKGIEGKSRKIFRLHP